MISQGIQRNSNLYSLYELAKTLESLIPINPDFQQPSVNPNKNVKNKLEDYIMSSNDVRNVMLMFNLYFPNEDTWSSVVIVYKKFI